MMLASYAPADGRSADAPPATAPARAATHAPAGRGLRVEVVTTLPALEALAAEWSELFARTPEPLPFRTHEWAVAWWKHLRRAGRFVHDALRVFVMRDAAGAAVAFAPYILTRYRVAGVPVCRILQPIGADPNLTELRGMLVAADREAEVVAALAAHLQREGGYDWMRWSGLHLDGDAPAALLRQPGAYADRQISVFRLSLTESWEEFRKSRPRNVRESLRKCYNSLTRDGHAWSFRCLDSSAEVAASLDRFFDLHGRRAVADMGISHPDYFASEQVRGFVAEVVQRAGPRARMYQLEIAGEAVAMRLGFRFGDEVYLYYSGFDPAWGRYSVMTTVVAEAIKHSIETGARVVNLSTGADVSKTRWRPDEVRYGDTVVVADGVRARLAHRAFHLAYERHKVGGLPVAPAPAEETTDA